jgi:hypothetical protein
MRNVIRPLLVAAALAASALPALAAPSVEGARPYDKIDWLKVAQEGGGRWRGRGPGGGPSENVQFAPLEVVLANVAAQFRGHHLGVDGPIQREGRWIYRIKWLTPEGRVIIVFADAQTGQVLGSRG